MSFYEELSSVYDIVFPEDKETTEFLSSGLKKGDKVLDLACGTGIYTIALGKKGFDSVGIDLDETMIQIAKDKAKAESVTFYSGDMLQFNNFVAEKNFDLIYCIGNSMVHLNDREAVENLIKTVYEKLEVNGAFVVQIINYNRIVNKDIKSLPAIYDKEKGVQFIRNYRFDHTKEKIHFETKLIINKDGLDKIYENSVPLLPIKSDELLTMLRKVGFSTIYLHGEFAEVEFNEDSYVVVLKAIK